MQPPLLARFGLPAAIAAAAITGFVAYRSLGPDTPPPPAVSAPVAGLPALRPVFSLEDATGRMRSITEWDGRALVVNFWATWCPPCRREIPLLNELQREHAADGVQVIGVAVDFRDDVRSYLEQTPVEYPVLIGEQAGLDVMRAFGMETAGFPFTVFTDRKGVIVAVFVGELHRPQAQAILATVRDVDAGRLTAMAARTRIEQQLAALKASPGES
jgi:thiol-disulfide isomerase/thioredoxin